MTGTRYFSKSKLLQLIRQWRRIYFQYPRPDIVSEQEGSSLGGKERIHTGWAYAACSEQTRRRHILLRRYSRQDPAWTKKKKNDEEHDTHVEHRHLHTTIHSSFPAAMIRMKECLSMGTTQSVLKARINLWDATWCILITLLYRIRQIDTENVRSKCCR